MIQTSEILDTLRMIDREKLDVRTITMGISLFPCVSDDIGVLCRRVYDRIARKAERLVAVGEEIEREFGVPIVNKRISVTPAALILAARRTPCRWRGRWTTRPRPPAWTSSAAIRRWCRRA